MKRESLAMQQASDGAEGSAGASASEPEQPPAEQVQGSAPSAAEPGAQDHALDTDDTPGTPPGAHLDAPAASAVGETEAPAPAFMHLRDGAVCLVHKGADKIPVQVKDQAHYARLVAEHGDGSVEILPEGAA